MGISVDTMNRYMASLEDSLGIKLLQNSGKGCVLTAKAHHIADVVESAQNLLENIYRNDFRDSTEDYRGTVKILFPLGLSFNLLPYDFLNFCETYPDIRVISCLMLDHYDMDKEEAELAILAKPPENFNKVALLYEKDVECGLFASPRYINRYGYPSSIDDLCERHRLVNRIGNEKILSDWKAIIDKCKSVYFQSNSAYSLVRAISNGMGIGVLPRRFEDKGFIFIDNIPFSSKLTFYLVANKATINLPKVKVVADYYKTLLDGM